MFWDWFYFLCDHYSLERCPSITCKTIGSLVLPTGPSSLMASDENNSPGLIKCSEILISSFLHRIRITLKMKQFSMLAGPSCRMASDEKHSWPDVFWDLISSSPHHFKDASVLVESDTQFSPILCGPSICWQEMRFKQAWPDVFWDLI